MNKEELAESIAQKTGIKKAMAVKFVESFITSLEETILAGRRVTISGFGTFEAIKHRERKVMNPATKEPMVIPAQITARFRASKKLKETIKGAYG